MTHYFDEQPSGRSKPKTIDVLLPDIAFSLVTDREVFSRGELDVGTSLLLREAPPLPPAGRLLDLGCGAGPIAVAMALRAPEAEVWAVDVNARARDVSTENAARQGLTNVRVAHPDEVPDGIRFDVIWSNPPIRIGKEALHDLLERWLARLDGDAVLVVQKHLGADSLQRWLTTRGYPTERIVSRRGFRLLQTSAPPPEKASDIV